MILLITAFVLLLGCGPFEEVFVEEDLLERPPAKRCSDCHTQIYKEWLKSRHAKAWTSEHFRKESENYTKTKCLPCHAPHQVDPLKKPLLRAEFREDGVSCVACHFKEETRSMHGPLKVWSPPHPSKKDTSYLKSQFCAGCHQETFKEWKRTKTDKTCQSCHMPSLGKEDLIQKFPFYLFHLAKPRTSHEFPTLKVKGEDIRLELKGSSLLLTNTGVPHNLPTADQGNPKLYLIAKVTYKDGSTKTVRRIFSPQAKNALPYGTPRVVRLPAGEIERVDVKLFRKLSWQKEKELIKEQELLPESR